MNKTLVKALEKKENLIIPSNERSMIYTYCDVCKSKKNRFIKNPE